MIPHPNPITVSSSFDKTWITSARILIGSGGMISYVRYNGEQTLSERHTFVQIESDKRELLEPIISATAKRLFGITQLKHILVQSTFPDRPIRIVFTDHNDMPYRINDVVLLATTDLVFAAAFDLVMTHLGQIINR